MKRTILAATAAALLASATFGIAAPGKWAGGPERHSPEQMAENASAMSDARIAALKAGLKLTPDQEKLWPALETALRSYSDERIEARKEWREKHAELRKQRGPGPQDAARGAEGASPEAAEAKPARPQRNAVEAMQQRAERMVERGTALKGLADAAAPLYASLDDAQKHRFNLLFREARGEKRMASFHERGRHGQGGPGWHRQDVSGPRHGHDGHRAPPPPQGERL